MVIDQAGVLYDREHEVSTSCLDPKKRGSRVDFLIGPLGASNTVVLLEVDEHQHGSYEVSCEVRRMSDVAAAFTTEGNTLPVAWIRFNPDHYTRGGVRIPRISIAKRMEPVMALIRSLERAPAGSVPQLSVRYYYYDQTSKGRPLVIDDEDYNEFFRSFVVQV